MAWDWQYLASALGGAAIRNSPWCVLFALRCAHQGRGAARFPEPAAENASTSVLYACYKRNGILLDDPVPGCIGTVRGGRTSHSHMFLVHDVLGDSVLGVDGNWGNKVACSRRDVTMCDYGPLLDPARLARR